MDLELTDKVFLVAGSSRGIGLAAARAFVLEGARVAITGRDGASLARAEAKLLALGPSPQVLAHAGDLRIPDVIDDLLHQINERWGRIHGLVANVGNGRGAQGLNVADEEWQRLLEENFASAWRIVQRVLPVLSNADGGSIVFVASIAGLEATGAPMPYAAAKAALVNYAKNLARHAALQNIRVNTVAPGNVLFEGGSWERHLTERRDEVLRHIETEVPLRRFARTDEIADSIVFLSSARASFISGACLVVDGGQTRGI